MPTHEENPLTSEPKENKEEETDLGQKLPNEHVNEETKPTNVYENQIACLIGFSWLAIIIFF